MSASEEKEYYRINLNRLKSKRADLETEYKKKKHELSQRERYVRKHDKQQRELSKIDAQKELGRIKSATAVAVEDAKRSTAAALLDIKNQTAAAVHKIKKEASKAKTERDYAVAGLEKGIKDLETKAEAAKSSREPKARKPPWGGAKASTVPQKQKPTPPWESDAPSIAPRPRKRHRDSEDELYWWGGAKASTVPQKQKPTPPWGSDATSTAPRPRKMQRDSKDVASWKNRVPQATDFQDYGDVMRDSMQDSDY